MKIKLVCLFMFGILCILNAPAFAAIAGPYAADGNTLHLYHLDEPDQSATVFDSATTPLNMLGVYNVQGSGAGSANGWAGFNNQGITPALLGNGSVSGFGTAADFSANALLPVLANNATAANVAHRPIIAAASMLANGTADSVPFTFTNPTTANGAAVGAFTFEAVVKLEFDPTITNYRTTTGGTGGQAGMEIISGEGDQLADTARPWQFRLDQIGFGGGAATQTGVKLEFNGITGPGGGNFFAMLPTTGPDAVNNTDWFHVAVTYDGNDNTANNIKFYWTKMDPSNTVDNLLTTITSTGATPTTWMKDVLATTPCDFAIGDEDRDSSTGSGNGEGESFVGLIDEVRISSVARGADQMMFNVPEPATGLMALIGFLGMGLLWIRRK